MTGEHGKAFPGKPIRTRRMSPIRILAKYKISLQQERFCQYYTSPGEFFGNGVQSYIAVYDPDLTKKNAYVIASNHARVVLANRHVVRRINDLLIADGFNDMHVDKQLLFLISQYSDFGTKLGAIREFNKLKSRIVDRMEHTIKTPVTSINIMPPVTTREEVEAIRAAKKLSEEHA